MHQVSVTNKGGLKCDNECLPDPHGLPCRHKIAYNKVIVAIRDCHLQWLEKYGCGQMDGVVRRIHGDSRHPDFRTSYSENENTLEGKKDLAASRSNENPFGDEEFLNPVFGEVASQFHTKDEKELISNTQN